MPESMNIPRRCQLQLMTPAEVAIREAMLAVEELPPDLRLTNALIALGEAREHVADFVDDTQRPTQPPTFFVDPLFGLSGRQTATDVDLADVVRVGLALSPINVVQVTDPRSSHPTPGKLETAARTLLDRMDVIHAHPLYRRVWELAQLHGGPYEGPKYQEQVKALREALSEQSSSEQSSESE